MSEELKKERKRVNQAKQFAIKKVKESHYLAKLKNCLSETADNYDVTVRGNKIYCFLFTETVFTVSK